VLDTGIGMGYISPPAQAGEELEVRIRSRWVQGHVARPPFHETK